MAQLGARLNGIEEVVGSNPTGSTPIKGLGSRDRGSYLQPDKSSRLSARELGSPGASPNKGVSRTPLKKPNSLIIPFGKAALVKSIRN